MGYSIYQDMQEVNENPDKWINHGQQILRASCNHYNANEDNKKEFDNRSEQDKKDYTNDQFEDWCKDSFKSSNIDYKDWCEDCDISEDSATPMMNYLYPLELKDFDEDKILKVVKETNCTILENDDSGEWFLTLCGGGMDLSQDIAYSYQILETWIPQDLLRNVCKQPLLSLGSKNYKQLAKGIIKQLKMETDRNKEKAKEWKESLKNLQNQEKTKMEQKEKTI